MTSGQVENARKATGERLKGFETQRARFDDPQIFAEMRNTLDTQAATEKQEFESARAKWEEQCPPDFRTLIAKRLRGDVNVHDSSTIMRQDDEPEEHAEGRRRDSEEVDGRELGDVVGVKRPPGLGRGRQRAAGRAMNRANMLAGNGIEPRPGPGTAACSEDCD